MNKNEVLSYLYDFTRFLTANLKGELPEIILFGSIARGDFHKDSDIDLYIETSSKKEVNLAEFEKKLSRKIQLFRHKNIAKIKNNNLINNIMNGISLNGFVEVIK